ncbi:hypothetical protein HYV85_03000 [Candidatus Woesearchaeota archaeon]|nr:hypothetical protein [Candidatus Woesearchaeota archaeon]
MASLIYVTNDNNSLFVMRVASRLVGFLPSGAAILTAVIRRRGEPTPELEQQAPGISWQEPLKLGDLEVIVTKSSQLNVHEPVPSDSDDSDAHYFGRNDELGVLLQYLGPAAWRTKDAVAHTSVHHHEKSRETYYLLDGIASIKLRYFKTGDRIEVLPTELGVGQAQGYLRGFTVQPFIQHPVVASNGTHSIMLLVTNPPDNTKSDHHYDGSFRDIFP